MLSPMQRSLAYLRGLGYRCHITEHYAFRKKHDLFGFTDILCLRGEEILAVQTTTRSNVSARVQKIMDCEELPYVRKAGIRIVVHGWGYMARSKTWELKQVDMS